MFTKMLLKASCHKVKTTQRAPASKVLQHTQQLVHVISLQVDLQLAIWQMLQPLWQFSFAHTNQTPRSSIKGGMHLSRRYEAGTLRILPPSYLVMHSVGCACVSAVKINQGYLQHGTGRYAAAAPYEKVQCRHCSQLLQAADASDKASVGTLLTCVHDHTKNHSHCSRPSACGSR
jgi:hypothetical protein